MVQKNFSFNLLLQWMKPKLILLYTLITLHKTRIKHDSFDFKLRFFLDKKTSRVTKKIDQILIINWTY